MKSREKILMQKIAKREKYKKKLGDKAAASQIDGEKEFKIQTMLFHW